MYFVEVLAVGFGSEVGFGSFDVVGGHGNLHVEGCVIAHVEVEDVSGRLLPRVLLCKLFGRENRFVELDDEVVGALHPFAAAGVAGDGAVALEGDFVVEDMGVKPFFLPDQSVLEVGQHVGRFIFGEGVSVEGNVRCSGDLHLHLVFGQLHGVVAGGCLLGGFVEAAAQVAALLAGEGLHKQVAQVHAAGAVEAVL